MCLQKVESNFLKKVLRHLYSSQLTCQQQILKISVTACILRGRLIIEEVIQHRHDVV